MDQPPIETPADHQKTDRNAFIIAENAQVEFFGASFLGTVVLLLLFALLRAQKRNRRLLREMMAMQTDAAEATKQ